MTRRFNRIAKLSAIGMCCSLAVWVTGSNAKDEESVIVKKSAIAPADGPALPPPANPKTSVPPQKTPPRAEQPAVKQPAPKQPFMRPADPREPAHGKLTNVEPMPAPDGSIVEHPPLEAGGIVTRPAPPIKYDTDHDARRMYRSGQINLVMVTQNPADGCYYEIPMCIPACCTGEPSISGGRGILGRGVVEYCWPCGFTAKVKFRHVFGDVKVDYEGD